MFGKKMTKEQVLNAFKSLSAEEQDELLKALSVADEQPVEEEVKKEEVVEEQPVEEHEEVVEDEVKEEGEPVPDEAPTDVADEGAVVEQEEIEEDNKEVIIKQLTDRLEELEQRLSDVCAKIDAYEEKDANKFGYAGKGIGAKKDIKDMSASELRSSILAGEY